MKQSLVSAVPRNRCRQDYRRWERPGRCRLARRGCEEAGNHAQRLRHASPARRSRVNQHFEVMALIVGWSPRQRLNVHPAGPMTKIQAAHPGWLSSEEIR